MAGHSEAGQWQAAKSLAKVRANSLSASCPFHIKASNADDLCLGVAAMLGAARVDASWQAFLKREGRLSIPWRHERTMKA